MRPGSVILSLSLALLSATTPAYGSEHGWGLWDPLADTAETGTVDSLVDHKVAMKKQGYTLVSSTSKDGLTLALWEPIDASTTAKRSLLPDILPGIRRGLPAARRGPLPEPVAAPAPAPPLAAPLVKRASDIQGRHCSTACAYQNFQKADTSDCISAYRKLYSTTGVFTLAKHQALSATSDGKNCSIWTVNNSEQDITYDYWDAAGTGQWLNGACLINQGATVGVCTYEGIGTNATNGVYTAVCHPSFMNTQDRKSVV